jgi:DNA mismatch repair protein MutS
VVEGALAVDREKDFIANDCDLAENQRLWLVTGPNMAGKSTFLRQNALTAVLAQAGSFVPAEDAHIGVVDRLFSRVGAADDLARGRSTFMVEMVETATILNRATDRSLVILDEIGRGTATFDGLSIAWATLENLHEVNRCRALFATHFHELTSLTSRLDALSCHSMRVKEWEGEVVFLHEVIAGVADQSYGVHVAKLAGLPPSVIARAEQVLRILEEGEQSGSLARLAEDLPLFSAIAADTPAILAPSPVEEMLSTINPDELTPREALEILYRLTTLGREP